ncbi:MAG: histidine kinase [Myxococcota bacterium]
MVAKKTQSAPENDGDRPLAREPVDADLSVVEIWWALLEPRRLLLILALGVPLVLVQGELLASLWGSFVMSLVVAGLVLLAPVIYQRLLGFGRSPSTWGLRAAAYIAAGAVAPLAVSIVPSLLEIPSFVSTDTTAFISAGLFWVAGYGLGRDIDLERRWLTSHRRARALAAQAEHAQLLALRAHLDPHFLFNTLNAIAEWCREDPEVAERALMDLSDLLRRVLVGVRAPTWPLANELDLVRRLFELHLIRDPGRFTLSWPSRIPDGHVPPMLLLPLAENAMTHSRRHRGEVRLSVERRDHRIRVEIANPGQFSGRRPGGEGIAITERRLQLAFGGQARLHIQGDQDRTRAIVEWPDEVPS